MLTRALLLIMLALTSMTLGACATTTAAIPRPFPSPDWKTPAPRTPNVPTAPAPSDVAGTSAPDPGPAPLDTVEGGPSDIPDLTAHRYDGRALAQYALGLRGVPYRPGGADPAGFDCSGLVQYVFAQYGIIIPRVVEQQYTIGDKIKPSEIKPGDLLFFATKRADGASHVAISIGGDQFVHAPNSTGVVRIETLSSTYWGSKYVGARRIVRST